jgi:hypothetical protein
MSDFLTNLAIRGAGAAETIQPRLPALFEPPRTTGRSFATRAADSPEAEQTYEEVSRRPRNGEPAPAQSPMRGVPREIPRVDSQPEERPMASMRAVAIPQLSPLPVVRPVPDAAATESQPQTLPQPSAPAPRPLVLPAADGRAPQILERVEPQPTPLLPRMERKPIDGTKAKPEPAAPRAESPRLAPSPAPRAVGPVVQPRVAPRVEKPKPAPGPVGPKEAGSVVHVSIGRIEVRATPQPAGERRERAVASTATSLDQYLRSRAKRGLE